LEAPHAQTEQPVSVAKRPLGEGTGARGWPDRQSAAGPSSL